ncbi:hypothetical protein AB0H71_13630 [Nocardia sp. NPDC050697]|uniref:hypothetical protein n=1 Tax=Nocardia sp. NPDC050697 TaxID=3155158 RepID=UPI0033D6A5FC
MTLRLGKLPARINSVHLRLSTYLNVPAVSPLIPAAFVPELPDLPMLGADETACGVWAGFAYEVTLASREAGAEVGFSAGSVLSDYTAAVGYDPADPRTDVGSDLQVAASYRRRIGVLDNTGRRHRVGAYATLTIGDPDQLAAAAFIFGSVGVGLRLPGHALDDLAAGRAWESRQGLPAVVGCHYVPVVGRAENGNFLALAWGRVQEMSPMFYRRYCDEVLVYFSEEFMTAPASPPGFDRAQLLIDLQAFTRR